MTNQDPYISDSLDYIYLDINQTSLEPDVDEYGSSSGSVIESMDYVSVLSSPDLTYGRKYFVQCNFFVGGDEETPYDYRILDGTGSPFTDGVFSIKNTKASGTGYEDSSNKGSYGSWFKVFYANSNSPIYFETKANGVDSNSHVYYVQFLVIDITDLKYGYHYFYEEDPVYKSIIKTSYDIQPDEDLETISEWTILGNYSILDPTGSTLTIRMYNNDSFVYADESGMNDDELRTNRPKVIFNNISVNETTNISLKHSSSDSGQIYYPKLFGLRTDIFNDGYTFSSDGDSFPLYACEPSSLIKEDETNVNDTEFFLLGQISHDEVNSFYNKISSNFSSSTSQVTAYDAVSHDEFGQSVSVHGSIAVIGSNDFGSGISNSGAIYIYEHDGSDWNYVQKIITGLRNDSFGNNVLAYNNMIFVGSADASNNYEGAVYVYKKESSTWVESQKIKADTPNSNDYFGFAADHSPISCYENTLVIGAYANDESGFAQSGSVYVFKYNGSTWVQESQLFASDPEASAAFGKSVSIYNTTIAVGSPNFTASADGAAYIFDYSDQTSPLWTESQKIIASDSTVSNVFGTSVSVHGNILAIGAPLHNHDGSLDGAVYVYEKDTCINSWTETELIKNNHNIVDHFGWSVSVYDEVIAIGAYRYPGVSGPIVSRGGVWVYERSQIGVWNEVEIILPDESDGTGDYFGFSVSMYENTILSGSPMSEDSLINSGSAFFCEASLEPSARPHNNVGFSCEITVDEDNIISYPIDKYSISYDAKVAYPDDFQKYSVRNQIIPFSLHVPSVSSSLKLEFNVYNNGLIENTTFKDFKYVLLSNKVKRYSPTPVLLKGKSLKEIYPDLMICSYTNSGIDDASEILGGFDTEDPRNYAIDGLGNKLPFRWSSGVKDYHFNRGKIDNPTSDQEMYRVLNLGHIPERPWPSRADIFDIDEYDVLSATIYDDTNIALRSKYFENDMEEIDEVISFYLILDKVDWYEGDGPTKIGIYQSYNSNQVTNLSLCNPHSHTLCFVELNFTEWNLSSTEKKIFQVFTYNAKNTNADDLDDEASSLGHWYVREIKPSSNTNRISRHFNYEDVFIEDTVTGFFDDAAFPLTNYKFVLKSTTEDGINGLYIQTHGRARSFQASDLFRDKEETTLDGFISKTEEDLKIDLEYQLSLESDDPYFYTSLDTSSPNIYFYMPPDWASLHMSYKLMSESLFNTEAATNTEWNSTTWSSGLFESYIDAVSLRLKIIKDALVNGNFPNLFSHNPASKVGLYSYRTNFYGDESNVDIIDTADYLMQKAYESAVDSYSLLEYSDYLQIELFPRWGELDSYTDSDLNDFIDMHLEYCQRVVSKGSSTCKMFPIVNHKVRNSLSNSHLMVLSAAQLRKFIDRIDYHIDKINFDFWEYGIFNESNYDNYYATPSSPTPSGNLGYSNEYIDSYPWTSNPLDSSGLNIDESLQPYIHGGSKENTPLWCYFMGVFDPEFTDEFGSIFGCS